MCKQNNSDQGAFTASSFSSWFLYVSGAIPRIGQDFKPVGGSIASKNYPNSYPNDDDEV